MSTVRWEASLPPAALPGVLPDANRRRNVDVEGSDHPKLRNLDAVVDGLQELNRDSLLFLAQQQDGLVVIVGGRTLRDVDRVQGHARGGLLQANDPESFLLLLQEPRKECLW